MNMPISFLQIWIMTSILFSEAIVSMQNLISDIADEEAVVIETQTPFPLETPQPTQHPPIEPSPTAEGTVITQIFNVVFSAETLAEAIAGVLNTAALQEAGQINAKTEMVKQVLIDILKNPTTGEFSRISAGSYSTAAAFAPALFIVRLVQYHWNSLLNEDDELLRVFGDWLAAGFLAVSAGPFLDLVVEAGWWMANTALGETHTLANQFISASLAPNELVNLVGSARFSILTGILAVIGVLGGLIGMVGLAAAFAISQAVLFVLAVVAPVVAVIAVLPQMRWMRGLWIKSVAVLSLLPVAAGGIFKAGVSLAAYFTGGGLYDILIRLFWLWGAAGFLLSLASILGRVTLTSALDSAVKAGKGVHSVFSKAVSAYGQYPGGFSSEGSAINFPAGFNVRHPSHKDGASKGDASGQMYVLSGAIQPGERAELDNLKVPHPMDDTRHPHFLLQDGTEFLEPYFDDAGLDFMQMKERYSVEVFALSRAFISNRDEITASPNPLLTAAQIAGAGKIAERLDPSGGYGGAG